MHEKIHASSTIQLDPPEKLVKTNTVLVSRSDQAVNEYTYYCPAYLRIKIKNFTQLSHEQLSASINTTIVLDIEVTGIPRNVQEHIRQHMILRFQRDQMIQLNSNRPQVVVKEYKIDSRDMISYKLRKTLKTDLVPEVFWTPFENLFLILSVALQHIEMKEESFYKVVQKNIQSKEYQWYNMKNNFQKRVQVSFQENIGDDYQNDFSNNFQNFQNDFQRNYQRPTKVYEPKPMKLISKESVETKKVKVKFNLMDKYQKVQYVDEEGEEVADMDKIAFTHSSYFGNYDLAQKLLKVQYTNQNTAPRLKNLSQYQNQKCSCCFLCDFCSNCYNSCIKMVHKNKFKEEKVIFRNDKKIKAFQYAHFQIPMYRLPLVSLLTIFLPLWFLGLISLGIYFQERSLAQRIASIATVMIAYVALLPVVRHQLPPHPRVTFVQFLVYMQMLTSFFCLIEGVRIRDQSNPFDWSTNVWFLLSAYIQIIQVFAVVVLSLTYAFCWLPTYNAKVGVEDEFHINEWENIQCNNYFFKKLKDHKLDIYELNNNHSTKNLSEDSIEEY